MANSAPLSAAEQTSRDSTGIAPLLLTPGEAARALGISERTLWGISAPRGELPTIPIGRLIRYSVDDLRAWIDANRTGITP